jgi:hypothetical protein
MVLSIISGDDHTGAGLAGAAPAPKKNIANGVGRYYIV